MIHILIVTILGYIVLWRRSDSEVEVLYKHPVSILCILWIMLFVVSFIVGVTYLQGFPETLFMQGGVVLSQLLLLYACRLKVAQKESSFMKSFGGAFISVLIIQLAFMGFSGM